MGTKKTKIAHIPNLKEILERMYIEQNKSLREIAEAFNVSYECIRMHLKKFKILRRNKGRKKLECMLSVEELKRLYEEEGLSLTQIAKKANISLAAASKLLKEAGIAPKKGKRKTVLHTKEDIQKICEMYEKENKSIRRIARMLKTYDSLIWRRLKEANAQIRHWKRIGYNKNTNNNSEKINTY